MTTGIRSDGVCQVALTCLDEISKSSTKVIQVYGVVKVVGCVALPTLQNVEGWLCPEGNGHDAQSQMRGLETLFAAQHNGWGPGYGYWCRFMCTKCNPMDSPGASGSEKFSAPIRRPLNISSQYSYL